MNRHYCDAEGYAYCTACRTVSPWTSVIADVYPATRYEPEERTLICPECGCEDCLEDAHCHCDYCDRHLPIEEMSDNDNMCSDCYDSAVKSIGKYLEAHGTATELAAWHYMKG